MYCVEWRSQETINIVELSFDVRTPTKISLNEQLVISIEPEQHSDTRIDPHS